jgi:hypothetical protein
MSDMSKLENLLTQVKMQSIGNVPNVIMATPTKRNPKNKRGMPASMAKPDPSRSFLMLHLICLLDLRCKTAAQRRYLLPTAL